MKLTEITPSDWHDLQNQVARLFNEAGYDAQSPKTINLVRGQAEIDVFVTAKHELLKTLICECKYWNSPIPQEKVHAFRTIVQDSGAMIGIIISLNGFQSGAIKAAEQSNVLLKTWAEFQQMLLVPWTNRKLDMISNMSYPLAIYTDPYDCDKQLNNLDYQQYKILFGKYSQTFWEGRILLGEISEDWLKNNHSFEYQGKTYQAMETFFNDYINFITKALRDFDDFFSPCPVDKWKLEKPDVRILQRIF